MYTIRNAREHEVGILADVGFRSWEQVMSSIGGLEDMRPNARTAFLNFTRASWLTVTVIEQGGSLSGWAAREKLDELITDFWIDPSYQHQGLGSVLLAALEREIVRQGLESARVETHALNEQAIGFFAKHGYRINWLSAAYSPKLDQEVQSVGLSKVLVADSVEGYGPAR
ncbi:GNAT family N-acetyltransferase [Rhizobium halophilum]|uniref:GNAT family N-acetyltransferase n=1 Tax=Rhizobium halophilum TaxID=2846852 RepID=UPI001EFD8339|nr:GNAT family N-acetyltransferase [Rhizobium halophilum]MCF6370040.1 GNAT family N-acetyltransferase [Rhizobium halophilum]